MLEVFPPAVDAPGESLMQRLAIAIGTHAELAEVFERRAPTCPLSAELVSRAQRWIDHDRGTLH